MWLSSDIYLSSSAKARALQKYRAVIPLARDSREGEMAERRMGQMDFADHFVSDVVEATTTLDRIAALVDWTEVATLLSRLRSGVMGAPAYPALILFKAMLPQQWHGLSDPQLEEALKDRLSFRRFLGASSAAGPNDYNTQPHANAERTGRG